MSGYRMPPMNMVATYRPDYTHADTIARDTNLFRFAFPLIFSLGGFLAFAFTSSTRTFINFTVQSDERSSRIRVNIHIVVIAPPSHDASKK